MSSRSKSRAPIRARIPKAARESAMSITARISDLTSARADVLKAAAAGMGLDVEKDNYRVSEDWQFFERMVIPLPKQRRRAARAAKRVQKAS